MSYASHSNRNFQIMQSNGLPCGVPLFSCDEHLKNWCCHSVCLSIHPFFLSIFGAFGIKDGFNGNQWMFQGRLKSVPRVFSGCSNKFFGRFFSKLQIPQIYRVFQKKWCSVYFANISATKHWIFKSFFSPANWDPYANFEYKTISVRY